MSKLADSQAIALLESSAAKPCSRGRLRPFKMSVAPAWPSARAILRPRWPAALERNATRASSRKTSCAFIAAAIGRDRGKLQADAALPLRWWHNPQRTEEDGC